MTEYITETPDTTTRDIRIALKDRAELTETATKAECVVDVSDDLGVPEARVAEELTALTKDGEVYFVGEGADAEVRVV